MQWQIEIEAMLLPDSDKNGLGLGKFGVTPESQERHFRSLMKCGDPILLNFAFRWRGTEEGHKYWAKLCRNKGQKLTEELIERIKEIYVQWKLTS